MIRILLSTRPGGQDALYREYRTLKEETKKVEEIKRSVADIMRTESPRTRLTRVQGIEL